MIRTITIIDNFTKEEVFEAISNVNIRMQWDKVFTEFKIVETNDSEQFEVLYMSIKVKIIINNIVEISSSIRSRFRSEKKNLEGFP
jgi:hypothetical protein